jgi:hypothetical protein
MSLIAGIPLLENQKYFTIWKRMGTFTKIMLCKKYIKIGWKVKWNKLQKVLRNLCFIQMSLHNILLHLDYVGSYKLKLLWLLSPVILIQTLRFFFF